MPMSDSVFLDTNILLYTYSSTEPIKQEIAQNIVINNKTFISTQVLQELTNILTKKFKFSYQKATGVIEECCVNSDLSTNTKNTILLAHQIADKYGFSFYDSLIVSAALECDCSILYSEDMQHNQLISKTLRIVNPFK